MNSYKIRTILLSLSASVILGTTGCSSGGSDDAVHTTTAALSGIGIDGILMQADVCIDADNSGKCEVGEVTVQTDDYGKFTFPAGSPVGPLILSGGTDKSTGEAFKGILKAPAGSEVVTPLTSAIQSILDNNSSISTADAEATIKTAMGLGDIEVDLRTFDPYNGIDGTDSLAAQRILAKQTQLQILVHTTAAVIAGADDATDLSDAMSHVFNSLVKSLDTGAEVKLDAQAVAIATREAAAETYKYSSNRDALVVAVGTVAQDEATDAVSAANSAEAAIRGASSSNAIGVLDGAINDVNKEDGLATAATVNKQSTLTSAQRKAILEAREKEDAVAKEVAQKEAKAVAARLKAQKALEEAETQAEYAEAERLRADAAAVEKLAADRAEDEADLLRAKVNAEAVFLSSEELSRALLAANTAIGDAEEASWLAEQERLAAIASADAIANADAQELKRLQALSLINSYKSLANDAAKKSSEMLDAIQQIKDEGYSVASNLTTAQDANSIANTLVSVLNTYSGVDITYALEEKEKVLVQAKIVVDALSDAMYTKSVAVAAANILQGKIDRIEIIYDSVRVLENNISLEFSDTNLSSFDTNSSDVTKARNEIFSIAEDYPDVKVIADDLNSSSVKISEELATAALYLETVRTELSLISKERSNHNERAAISSKEKALSSYTLFNTQNSLIKKSIEELKEETLSQLIEARKIKENSEIDEENRIAQEIQASRDAAQLSLDIAVKDAEDANASAIAAAKSAEAAAIIADTNLNAAEFASIASLEAKNAAVAARLAEQAAASAKSTMNVLFTDGMSISDAKSAEADLKSFESSATEAATLAENAQNAAEQAYKDAQSAEVIEVNASKVFTLPYTWYETKLTKYSDGSDILKVKKMEISNGSLFETEEQYNLTTGLLLDDNSADKLRYVLKGNDWVSSTVSTPVTTLSSSDTVLHISGDSINADLRIVSVMNIATSIMPLGFIDANVTFSEGAVATNFEYRNTEDTYELEDRAEKNIGGNISYYDSIENFIADHVGVNRFSGSEEDAISFEKEFVGTLVEGSSGNLTSVINGKVGSVVGTWEYKKLGSSERLAIVCSLKDEGNDDVESTFYTMYDNSVYRGYASKASDTYEPLAGTAFNEVAYNDMKAAIEAYYIEANKFSLLAFIKGSTLYYIESTYILDRDEQKRSYKFDDNGSFTEIYTDGTTKVGVTYEVNENNITFSDEMSFRYIGKSDDNQGEVFYRFDHNENSAHGYVTLYSDEGYRDEVFNRIDLTELIRRDVFIKSQDGEFLANFEFRMDKDDGNVTTGARSDTGIWNGTWSLEGSVATIIATDGTVTTLEFFETPYLTSHEPIRVLINNSIEATYMRSSNMPSIFDEIEELPFVQSDGASGIYDFAYNEEIDADDNYQVFETIFNNTDNTLTIYYQDGTTKEITIELETDFTALPLTVTASDGTKTKLTVAFTLPTQSWKGVTIPKYFSYEVYDNHSIYDANIVKTDTKEIVRHRFEYDVNGDLLSDISSKYEYTLDADGKMVVDLGSDSKIFTLVHSDWDRETNQMVTFVIVEEDIAKDGVIDSSRVVAWGSKKPVNFPDAVTFTEALKVTSIKVGDTIELYYDDGSFFRSYTFVIDSDGKYTFTDNDDLTYRDTKGSGELVDSFYFQSIDHDTYYVMDFESGQYISYDGSTVVIFNGSKNKTYKVKIIRG